MSEGERPAESPARRALSAFSIGRTPACPSCGGTRCWVYGRSFEPLWVLRYRRCQRCGTRFIERTHVLTEALRKTARRVKPGG